MFNRILTAFSQESTWRGIIALVTASGVLISPELASNIIASGLSLIGIINIVKNK